MLETASAKRFHVHVSVPSLAEGIRFYSTLFNAQPSVAQPDYAKWMLEDPRINFAISARGGKAGVDHLGFQLASDEQLTAARERLQSADLAVLDEGNTSCCYANSDKHWITDPAGIAWETFRTLGSIPTFNGGVAAQPAAAACCGPAEVSVVAPVVQKTANSCGPKSGCC